MTAGTSSKPLSLALLLPPPPATAAAVVTTTASSATPIASFTRVLRMRDLLPTKCRPMLRSRLQVGSETLDEDDLRRRGGLPHRLQRRVLVGFVPGARRVGVGELHHDAALPRPRTLEHLDGAAARDEAAAVVGDRVRVAAAVLLQRFRIAEVARVGDHVGGHRPDVNGRGPGVIRRARGVLREALETPLYIMPPMPPMSGMPPPPPESFSGTSATIASVVRMFLAIDAAFCSADRVTI